MVNFRDLAERALWTAVQSAAGVVGTAQLSGVHSLASWATVGSAAGIAALLSVAKTLTAGGKTVVAAVEAAEPAVAATVAETAATDVAKAVPAIKLAEDVAAVAWHIAP